MLHRSVGKRGFTLVELMIVIAIIGILAGIMVPSFMKARAEANLSACQSNMKAIATAFRTFEIRHPVRDTSFDISTLVDEGYLKKMPKCPSGGTYSVPWSYNTGTGAFVVRAVFCCGQKHKGAGINGRFYGYSLLSGKFSDNDADFDVNM